MVHANLIGKKILGYTVSEELGSSAFGTVYKVIKSNVAGQYVRALKYITIPTKKQYNFVLNSMGGDVSKADKYFSEICNNIVLEIKILNDLSEKGVHHIVGYYENDIIVTNSPRQYDIFILMEYLTPLEDFIHSEDFFVRDVVRLGLDMLYGLQLCHNNGLVHRDIKEENIFVSDKGEYKIGNFGFSKVLKDSSEVESLKDISNFLASEVYFGKADYTKSMDLYSLGILLYRLLNYSSNPFLPHFPEQYFDQDKDAALEERMRGKTPVLPVLGGKEIGAVIVKAISNSSERFQSADEFINALELAINNTTSEILNKKIKFGTPSYSEPKAKQYGSAIGETALKSVSEEYIEDERNNFVQKYLFESIGEVSPTGIPEEDSVVRPEQNHRHESITETTHPNTNGRVVNNVFPNRSEPNEPVDLVKKVMNIFLYIIPVIILLVGVAANFIVIPNIYEGDISYVDWLLTDCQNIIKILRDSNDALPQTNNAIGIRIFWWIWLAGLITSLFFVGKKFQSKPEPNGANAMLTKKEAYLMIRDVTEALKHLKVRRSCKQLDSLIYEVKKLEEKLSVESDFKYGNSAVINCENNIARLIQFLLDTVSRIENGDFEENLKAMNTAVMNINTLLRRRIEMKKR